MYLHYAMNINLTRDSYINLFTLRFWKQIFSIEATLSLTWVSFHVICIYPLKPKRTSGACLYIVYDQHWMFWVWGFIYFSVRRNSYFDCELRRKCFYMDDWLQFILYTWNERVRRIFTCCGIDLLLYFDNFRNWWWINFLF